MSKEATKQRMGKEATKQQILLSRSPIPFYKAKILAVSHKFGMQLSARTDHTQHLSFSSSDPKDQGTRIHPRKAAFPLLHLTAKTKEGNDAGTGNTEGDRARLTLA